MGEVTMTLEEYLDLIRDADTPLKAYRAKQKARPPYGKAKPKRPRKLTTHNRFMKKEMRSLRKKHPRMKQTQIMKKANAAWRKKKRSKR
jgi:hypothetical protein